MRLAFSKPVPEAGLGTLIGTFRAEGYEGLQLKMGQFNSYLDKPQAFVDAWGSDPGIVSALIWFDTLDDEGASRLRSVISFAAAVGSERVVFCHNLSRQGLTLPDIAELGRTISKFGAEANESGVKLSLHHHFDQPVMHHDDFVAFFGATAPDTVGLTIDTAHLAKSGITDIPAFIREFAPIVDNIHLKDFADGEWRLLGRGQLDLPGIIDTLDSIGYAGWLCVDEESSATLSEGFDVSRNWLAGRV